MRLGPAVFLVERPHELYVPPAVAGLCRLFPASWCLDEVVVPPYDVTKDTTGRSAGHLIPGAPLLITIVFILALVLN